MNSSVLLFPSAYNLLIFFILYFFLCDSVAIFFKDVYQQNPNIAPNHNPLHHVCRIECDNQLYFE